MGVTNDPKAFVASFNKASKALADARNKQLDGLGVQMNTLFNRALSADLNKTGTPRGFSRWNPELTAQAKRRDESSLVFAPTGKSKGPLRVAESGREKYGVGERRHTGRFSKKTGAPLTRRPYKRAVGATKGKETWTDTIRLFEQNLPKKIGRGITEAMRKVFL